MKKPIAILTSDWHLTEKCPKARTGDDWWEAMRYALEQVRNLQDTLKVPVIIAGDTTDKNKHTHELQIFIMRNVPKGSVYVSFGQHDLPDNNMINVDKSCLQVLIEAGFFIHRKHMSLGKFHFFFQDWETELSNERPLDRKEVRIAVIHEMVYKKPPFPGCKDEGNLDDIYAKYEGYDIIVSGDNHNGFHHKRKDGRQIVNCGALMRCDANQIDYKPALWVLYDDLSVEPKYMDISRDTITREHLEEVEKREVRLNEFVSKIKSGITVELSFVKNLEAKLYNIDTNVKKWIRKAMGDKS